MKAGDLMGRLAALLEGAGDPVEVEMVLAGLASCSDRTVLVPLRRRAAAVLARGPREGVQRGWLRGQLRRLAGGRGRGRGRAPGRRSVRRRRLALGRLAEVERVLAGAEPPFTPLATPDSPGGFVDPRALLARLAGEPGPRHHDLVAALLRLGADGRDEALAGHAAARTAGPVDAVLRHALGAPAAGAAGRSEVPAAWLVAASRARAPVEQDEMLLDAGLAAAGQGRPVDARVVLHGRPGTYEDAPRTARLHLVGVAGGGRTCAGGPGDRPADGGRGA